MKILFVLEDTSSSKRMNHYLRFSFAAASIIASLENNKDQILLHHFRYKKERLTLEKVVKEFDPEIVLLSCYSYNLDNISLISNDIRSLSRSKIIVGGIHATLDPVGTMKAINCDYVLTGESDYTLPQLVQRLKEKEDLDGIPGLYNSAASNSVDIKIPKMIFNLDGLPFIHRKSFSNDRVFDHIYRSLPIMASRGCPFTCFHCCNEALREKMSIKNNWRVRSVESVIEEIKHTIKLNPGFYSSVIFYDDIFPSKHRWLEEFYNIYPREVNLPFVIQTRVELLDTSKVGMLVDSGCKEISVGIETGNEIIRKEKLNRKVTNDTIIEKITSLSNLGIRLGTYNMVGLPGESLKEIYETIELNSKLEPIGTHVSIFQPFPHSKLKEISLKDKLINENSKIKGFYEGSILNSDKITPEQIKFAQRIFEDLLSVKVYIKKFTPKIEKLVDNFIRDSFLSTQNLHKQVLFTIFIKTLGFTTDKKRYFGRVFTLIFPKYGWSLRKKMFKSFTKANKLKTGDL